MLLIIMFLPPGNASGQLRTVALEDEVAPGGGAGQVFRSFGWNPAINDVGQVAFLGYIAGAGVTTENSTAIWSEGSGALTMIVREGSAAPDVPGFSYSFLDEPVINDAGKVAFLAFADAPGDSIDGLWSDRGGAVNLVVRTDAHAPGTSPTTRFRDFSFGHVLNNQGKTAFRGELDGLDVTTDNNDGIWFDDGNTNLIVRAEDVAAGTSTTYIGLAAPKLNDAGQVAFLGYLAAGAFTSPNNQGIWSDRSGSLRSWSAPANPLPAHRSAICSIH